MSEQASSALGGPDHPLAQPASLTAGASLRKAREMAGLQIASLAVSLKVPVKKLEALEADRIDLLPDAVFARALAASVCRTLKINPDQILAGLPQLQRPGIHADAAGINTPFQAPVHGLRKSIWEQMSRPVGLAIVALVVGTLALVFFPIKNYSLTGDDKDSVPASVAGPVLQPPPASVAPAEATANAVNPQMALPAQIETGVPSAGATTIASANMLQGQVIAAAVPEQSGILVLKTRGVSWVEVTDAGGIVQLRKTMVEGEVVGLSAGLPMRVVLGRADMTDVLVRGKPFELTSAIKDNVARFEVR